MNYILNFIVTHEKILYWFFIVSGSFLLLILFVVYPQVLENPSPEIGEMNSKIFMWLWMFGGLVMLISGVAELSKLNNVRIIEREVYLTQAHNLTQWSKMVKTRDEFRCVYCGATENLDAHHLAPKSIFPRLKFSLLNGVTVCKSHHRVAADIFKRLQRICIIKPKGE